jgi:hypothetical protein
MRILKRLALFGVFLYLAAWEFRIIVRKYYIWLPRYVAWKVSPHETASGPVHLFFVLADHFEPGEHYELTDRWVAEYPRLADRHRDSLGRRPQHTWFYPAEQPLDRNMAVLGKLVTGGYGEVELHLHHSNDTAESGRRRYERGIAYFQKFGFLKTSDGTTHFAFIHGVWGLDNSNGPGFCGINRELEMLRQLGCFADYTFPSIYWESQPSIVNSIYEATDDDRPKSYDRGAPLRVGVKPVGDLLLIEGPLLLSFSLRPQQLFVRVESGEVHHVDPVGPARVDDWVSSRIHVQGRPEWQFLKVHTHGAESQEEASEDLGPHFDAALTHLETRYNDGTRYILHYVTAREAYNLARAAADGKTGDPRQYYDYVIPRYQADPAPWDGVRPVPGH